jgi:cobalamin transport system substrate-binding protein
MVSRLRLRLVALLVPLLLVGCALQTAPTLTPAASPVTSAASSPSPSSRPAYPLMLTDDAGRQVSLAAPPTRIVSLAPSNTEIVCALDRCDDLVGVTDFDDYPPQVAEVDKVVVFAQVDVEKVVAAEPDLILAAGNELTPTAVIDQLSGLGLPVLVLYPESLDGVYADIELVGHAIDAGATAGALVANMEARVAAVRAQVSGLEAPRTFYEVSLFEGVIYTAGARSFLASLIELAGGDPITGDALTTSIQLEDLVAADPELILLGDAAYDASVTPASVADRPGWGGMRAVIDGRVTPMLDDVVITRPGPRIVDGLEALARAIHPGALD